jgi:hypothetical protein
MNKLTPYIGTWRITEMDQWDRDYMDAEVPAYITIEREGQGRFQFGYVSGELSGEMIDDFGMEHFSFDWEGNDEMDDASGSGWLRIVEKGRLEGKLRFQGGDSTKLVAELQAAPAGKRK